MCVIVLCLCMCGPDIVFIYLFLCMCLCVCLSVDSLLMQVKKLCMFCSEGREAVLVTHGV